VLVACGIAAASVRAGGYAVPAWRRLASLRAWEFVVVEHVARRIAAPDVDGWVARVPSADDVDVAGYVDGYLARAPAAMRRDLGRFLAYIEHVAPLGAGFGSRFTRLGAFDQDRVLASIESSSNDLLRAGFEGIKALVFMGYYRDARTWGIVQYSGPWPELQRGPENGSWR